MTDEVPSWFPKSSVRPVSPTARLNYCLGSAAGEAADLHCWLFLFFFSPSLSLFLSLSSRLCKLSDTHLLNPP